MDPTLRDPMQNGAGATGLQFTRGRSQWDVTLELLPDDVAALQRFVEDEASYGVNAFLFPDNRDKRNPIF